MEANVVVIQWISSLLFAVLAAYFYIALAPQEAADELPETRSYRGKKRKSLFLAVFGGLVRRMGPLVALVPLDKTRAKLAKRLLQAGRPGGLNADEFQATRIIAVALGAAAGAFIDDSAQSAPAFALLLAFLGFIYPNLWLSGAIQKRRRAIFRTLPDTLDVLRLAVEAGLDLGSAMKVVVERGRPGPLLDELELVEREMTLGRTRREALKNFADRACMSEINSFVLAVVQADQLGASIGPVLKTQADLSRTRRWQMAETLVNKMPMKMLAPLVLFIFPSSFIILFTPLLIQWMQSK